MSAGGLHVSGHSEEEEAVEQAQPKPSKLGLGKLEREEQERQDQERREQLAQDRANKRRLLSEVARSEAPHNSNFSRSSEVENPGELLELFRQKVGLTEAVPQPSYEPGEITKMTTDQIKTMRAKVPDKVEETGIKKQVADGIIHVWFNFLATFMPKEGNRTNCHANGHQCAHCGTKIYVQKDGSFGLEQPKPEDRKQREDPSQAKVSASH
jgi:hypothetical protein